jgi:hypothetical protein
MKKTKYSELNTFPSLYIINERNNNDVGGHG